MTFFIIFTWFQIGLAAHLAITKDEPARWAFFVAIAFWPFFLFAMLFTVLHRMSESRDDTFEVKQDDCY